MCYICSTCESIPEFEGKYADHLAKFRSLYKDDLTKLGAASRNMRLFDELMVKLEEKVARNIQREGSGLKKLIDSEIERLGAVEHARRLNDIPPKVVDEYRQLVLGKPGTPRFEPGTTSQTVHKGKENPRWADALEYEVPGMSNDFRILKLKQADGTYKWGWTDQHYERGTIKEINL